MYFASISLSYGITFAKSRESSEDKRDSKTHFLNVLFRKLSPEREGETETGMEL